MTSAREDEPKPKEDDEPKHQESMPIPPFTPLKYLIARSMVMVAKDNFGKRFVLKRCDEESKEFYAKLKHECIVIYFGTLTMRGNMYAVMEYVETGSLYGHQICTYSRLQSTMRQVIEGIVYINQNGYTYNDIKTANILLLDDGSIKICDIDSCSKIGSPVKRITKGYRQDVNITVSRIVNESFGLGLLAIELVTGTVPYLYFKTLHEDFIENVLRDGIRMLDFDRELLGKLDTRLVQFILDATVVFHKKTPEELLELDFFKANFNDNDKIDIAEGFRRDNIEEQLYFEPCTQ